LSFADGGRELEDVAVSPFRGSMPDGGQWARRRGRKPSEIASIVSFESELRRVFTIQ
jgi:hypothetical protein